MLLTLTMLSGCITKKKCNNRFPPQIKDSIYIVEKTNTVYKDTTIYVRVKGDTVYKTDTVVYTEKGIMSLDTLKAETELALALSWVANSKLFLNLIQKDTALKAKLDSVIRLQNTEKNEYREKIIVKEVTFIPWWAKALMALAIPTILFIIVSVIRMFI